MSNYNCPPPRPPCETGGWRDLLALVALALGIWLVLWVSPDQFSR